MAIPQTTDGMERMERRVEALLTQSKSPNAAWATWMGAELETMHPDVWDQCRGQIYDVIRVWNGRSNNIRRRELAQQHQGPEPDEGYPAPSSSSAVDAAAASTAAAAAATLCQPLNVSASIFRLPDLHGCSRVNSLLHQRG